MGTRRKPAHSKRSGDSSNGLVALEVQNRTYSQLREQRLFVTPELRASLVKRKFRDGTRAYDSLVARGFRGGKHLLELIRQELGSDVEVVLSHEESSLTPGRVVINFEAFRNAGQQRFFEVYRQTGIRAATQFLND